MDVDDGRGWFPVSESSSDDFEFFGVLVEIGGAGVSHRVEVEVWSCDLFSGWCDVVSEVFAGDPCSIWLEEQGVSRVFGCDFFSPVVDVVLGCFKDG